MSKPVKEQIAADLIAYIKDNILEEGIALDAATPFREAGLDSMSIIELVLFIERKYGAAIPDTDLLPENLRSADTLAACTTKYL